MRKETKDSNFVDGEWVRFPKGLEIIRKLENNPNCKHDFVVFHPSYQPGGVPEPRAICTKCNSEFEMFDEKQRYTVVNDLKKLDQIGEVLSEALDNSLSIHLMGYSHHAALKKIKFILED